MFRKLTSIVCIVLLVSSSTIPAFGQQTGTTSGRGSQVQRPSGYYQQEGMLDEQRDIGMVPRGLDVPIDPDTYVIGPSDEFLLTLHGQTNVNMRLRVLPEGVVMLPNIGAFEAAGITITEFKKVLFASLSKYYKNMDYECQLISPRSFVVYVLGEVEVPGAVQLHVPFNAATALNKAGGTTKNGSLRYIELREEGKPNRIVDLFSFFGRGETDKNLVLQEGQSLYVPVKHTTAVVLGQVWNGGSFEIYEDETIADLIRFAGGPTYYADTERVVLERYDANGAVAVRTVSPSEIDTTKLRNKDIVVVPDRRSFAGGAFVRVLTGGGRDGMIFIEEGETIASFIPRFLQSREKADLSRAIIERRADDGKSEYFPVDLESIARGEADGTFKLQAGDVVAIPSIDQEVYVGGEVVKPGPVAYQRGLPAERYVSLAGGPNQSGSIDKLSIYSSDGTKRKGNRKSMIYQGDMVLVERKTSKVFGQIFLSLTTFTSLILSIVAVTRTR